MSIIRQKNLKKQQEDEIDFPEQYTHSIKISDTAKGIRLDVHVYATDKDTAVAEAFDTYIDARTKAGFCNIPLAPVEETK